MYFECFFETWNINTPVSKALWVSFSCLNVLMPPPLPADHCRQLPPEPGSAFLFPLSSSASHRRLFNLQFLCCMIVKLLDAAAGVIWRYILKIKLNSVNLRMTMAKMHQLISLTSHFHNFHCQLCFRVLAHTIRK